MHFLTATIPAAVICEPDTSLIWPGGAGAVIDQDALAQPQIDNVLLARHLFRHSR